MSDRENFGYNNDYRKIYNFELIKKSFENYKNTIYNKDNNYIPFMYS